MEFGQLSSTPTPFARNYFKFTGEASPVDKKDLPVLLPEEVDLNMKGNPLETHPTWKFTQFSNGEKAIRETDTLDTFVDSSWYFLRFCSPKYKKYGYQIEDINYWMPVDQYIGGVEHAILLTMLN